MKCTKCKFKDENTGICTFPFEETAVGGHELDKKGNIIGCTHGRNKYGYRFHAKKFKMRNELIFNVSCV